MPNNLSEEFGSATGQALLDPALRRDIGHQIRRTLGSGQVSFVLALQLLTLAGVLFRVSLAAHDNYFGSLHDQYVSSLSAEQEPRREEKSMGIVAAVLGPLNAGHGLLRREVDLQELTGTAQDDLEALDGLVEQVAETRLTSHPADLQVAPYDPPKSTSDYQQSLGSALAYKTPFSLSLLPAELVPIGSATFLRFIGETQPFEDALRRISDSPDAGGLTSAEAALHRATHRPRWPVVQAYVISCQGALRIWNKNMGATNGFSPTRNWSAASYFEGLLESHNADSDWSLSPAYVDYGGYGVVRTLAQRIVTEGEFRGIVAFDLKVPETDLTSPLTKSIYLEVRRVVVSFRHGIPKVRASQSISTGSRAPTEAGWTEEELARALAMCAKTTGGTESLGRQTLPLHVPESNRVLYWLPLGALPGGQAGNPPDLSALVLSVTPPRSPVAGSAFLFLALLFGAAALAVLLHGLVRQADRRVHMERLAVLRGLQVGVIDVHHGPHADTTIGNGRAEEILNAQLARLGTGSGAVLDISDRVLSVLVPHESEERDIADALPGNLVRTTYEAIQQARRQGVASSYYVLLDMGDHKQWLLVRGAPFLPRKDSFSTVATIARAPIDRATALSNRWESRP